MAIIEMSLYEALSKKKIYEDKVRKLERYRLVDIKKKHDEVNTSGVKIEDIKTQIDAGYQSSVAILNNYITLKAAINEANAVTKVEIAGKEYTIANAIARQRGLDQEEALYSRMIANINSINSEVERTNSKYLSPEAISKYVSSVLGDSKKSDELIRQVTEDYKKEHEVEIYDPLNTEELATKKLEEIAQFREEIHYKLTQVNCTTTITVGLED